MVYLVLRCEDIAACAAAAAAAAAAAEAESLVATTLALWQAIRQLPSVLRKGYSHGGMVLVNNDSWGTY